MDKSFLKLPTDLQLEALATAASASGRPIHLLQKDVWVVWSLATIFGAPFADHLVFKGGTSLSKGYNAIQRFSEDIDLTYDIRALIPDMVGDSAEALPPNRSQERKWSSQVRTRLPEWVEKTVVPVIEEALQRDKLSAELCVANEKVFIKYEPLARGSGYVSPSVMLEFGARSTGEPAEERHIVCDAAKHLNALSFPEARPRTMRVERTFWEKATAAHVYCLQGRARGDRFARHWYDLVRLDETGHADAALKDRNLAMSVARHKAMFFAEKDKDGRSVDYEAAVHGCLSLVPNGDSYDALSDDYRKMVEDGLLLNKPETFKVLMEKCQRIEEKANR